MLRRCGCRRSARAAATCRCPAAGPRSLTTAIRCSPVPEPDLLVEHDGAADVLDERRAASYRRRKRRSADGHGDGVPAAARLAVAHAARTTRSAGRRTARRGRPRSRPARAPPRRRRAPRRRWWVWTQTGCYGSAERHVRHHRACSSGADRDARCPVDGRMRRRFAASTMRPMASPTTSLGPRRSRHRAGSSRPVRLDPQGARRSHPRRRPRAAAGAGRARVSTCPPTWTRTSPSSGFSSSRCGSVRRGAVTGWAGCRLHGAAFFDGLAADGRTRLPVPLVTGGTTLRGDASVRVLAGPDLLARRRRRPARRPDDPRRAGALRRHALRGTLREAVVAMDMAAAADLVSIRRTRHHLATRTGCRGAPTGRPGARPRGRAQPLAERDAHAPGLGARRRAADPARQPARVRPSTVAFSASSTCSTCERRAGG